MTTLFSRANTSPLARWWWQIDRGMLAVFILLMVVGVILMGAAGPAVAMRIGASPYMFFTKHIYYLIVSFSAMIAVSFLPVRMIRRGALILLLLAMAGCVLALFAGMDIKGAKRWIELGPFSLQPSEFMKPAFFVASAWLLSLPKSVAGYRGVMLSAFLCALCIGLLMLQPDLGMTFVTTAVWGIQIVLAGLPIWIMLGLIPMSILGAVGVYYSFPHVASRIDRFLNPESGDTYQVDKSLQAFANGGWFGEGPGQGEVIRHLPDAHADFIFSVAAEELGLLAVWGIIGLYLFLILRGTDRLSQCRDLFIVLAASALLAQIGLQAIVHMGSSVHLLPTKGMTLPFLSYGGSSLISLGVIAGALLALTRRDVAGAQGAARFVADPSIPRKPE